VGNKKIWFREEKEVSKTSPIQRFFKIYANPKMLKAPYTIPIIAANPTTDHIATSPVLQDEVFVSLTVGINKFATKTIPSTKDIIPLIKFAI